MNLPNQISVARILLTPVMLALFLLDGVIPLHIGALAATAVFLIAAASDGIDGHIARKRGLVTTLGKFLDSIADKILCVVAMVMLIPAVPAMPAFPSCAAVLTAMITIQIARDFIISALRQIAAAQSVILAADMWGKVKAVCDYVAIPVLMAGPAISALGGFDPLYFYAVGFAFFAAATLMSVISGAHYLLRNRALLQCA